MSHPNLERELTPHELGFLDLSTTTRQQIVSGTLFFDSTIDIEAIRLRMRDYLQHHPQFRCRISCDDIPKWAYCDPFNLDFHIKEMVAPSSSRDDILTLAASTAAGGLSAELPLWRMILVHFTPENQAEQSALIIIAHHSLIDGLQGLELVNELTKSGNRTRERPTKKPGVNPPFKKANLGTRFACYTRLIRETFRRSAGNSPRSKKIQTSNRRTVSLTWGREIINQIKAKLDCSLQEVVLGVMGDALSQFSFDQNHRGDVKVILPVGNSEPQAHSFITNRHDVGLLKLGTRTPLSWPRKLTLSSIRSQINRIRKEQRLGVFPTILSLVSKLPRSLRQYCFHKYAAKGDLLISLIPSGRKRRHLDQSELTAIYAQPAIPPGHALAIGIVIYADQIAISLQYDPNLITEIDHLARRIKESIGRWIGDLTKTDGVAANYLATC